MTAGTHTRSPYQPDRVHIESHDGDGIAHSKASGHRVRSPRFNEDRITEIGGFYRAFKAFPEDRMSSIRGDTQA